VSCTYKNDVLARVADPSCCRLYGLFWTVKCGNNTSNEYVVVWDGWEIQAAVGSVICGWLSPVSVMITLKVMVVGLARRLKVPAQCNAY
jgi:hypothetical protein